MVKPSLAQNRLGRPPTEVPIPSNPTQSSPTCCGTLGTLFFKPVFEPIQKSQALCECFWHTGSWSNSSTIMRLNVEEQKQNFIQLQFSDFLGCQIKTGYVCAMIGFGFRVMLAFLVIQHPQQLEKGFLSSLGHNPSQPLVTVSSSPTAPSSPCISLGILLSDGVQCLCWTMTF